jgi:L-threonylcarbamoyladenylate synthase
MKIVKLQKTAINEAIKFLNNGGIVIFPTDTVYGFLALAENKKAVAKIYKIKNRSKTKPLPVFVKDIKMAKDLAEILKIQEKILKKRWPGKYTFILNKKNSNKTIALRIPKYKPLNDLLKKINKPLAQTSVNISCQPSIAKIKDVIFMLKKCGTSDIPHFLIIDGGDLPKSKPSKIIDLTKNKIKILRK